MSPTVDPRHTWNSRRSACGVSDRQTVMYAGGRSGAASERWRNIWQAMRLRSDAGAEANSAAHPAKGVVSHPDAILASTEARQERRKNTVVDRRGRRLEWVSGARSGQFDGFAGTRSGRPDGVAVDAVSVTIWRSSGHYEGPAMAIGPGVTHS